MLESEYIIKDAVEFEKIRFLFPYIKGKGGFIAGGIFKDLFHGNPYRDIDMFFKNDISFKMNMEYLTNKRLFKLTYQNKNATGLKNDSKRINIDLVSRIFGSPEDILDSFDFTVSKFCLYEENRKIKVLYHRSYFEDLTNKRLRFNHDTLQPISLLNRVLKYSKYGFKLEKKDFLFLVEQINKLDSKVIHEQSMDYFYAYY
jgi:hypothetical protein